MERKHTLAAVLVSLAITSPLAVNGLTAALSSTPTLWELKQQASEDRASWTQAKRDYAEAVMICVNMRAKGQNVKCPDFSDKERIQAFLRGDIAAMSQTGAVLHGAASVPVLNFADLVVGDQSLLRRYQRVQTCPITLKTGKQPGFYELCLEMIKDTSRSKVNR